MDEKIKVIIIDDERSARNALKIIIEEYATELELIGSATSAKEGLEQIKNKHPDVVFVDIQMPSMTGIELMESIGLEREFEIVFLTAYNNYAQEAFKLEAFDYLLKPINIPDFLALVKKLKKQKPIAQNNNEIKNLKNPFLNKIAIPSSTGVEFITISEIIRIEAAGSYTKVFLLTGNNKLYSKNLKAMEGLLTGHPFFRTHKSHLINLSHVQNYAPHKDGGTIVMVDGSEIIISRNQKEAFVALYKM